LFYEEKKINGNEIYFGNLLITENIIQDTLHNLSSERLFMGNYNQNIFPNSEPDSYEETDYLGEDEIEHGLNFDWHTDFDIS
jgi:hypothetical protein